MPIRIESPKAYKFLDYVNKHVSSDTQRLIMGVTAIATQPLIDLYNTDVDEETRWTSVMRTISKIVVGTTVGVIVRRSAINLVRKCPSLWDKSGTYKMPTADFWKNIDFSKKEHRDLNNYANTMGTIIGTAAGLVTNFVIDAPLTKLSTNYLNDNLKPICMKRFNDKKQGEQFNV